MPHKVTTFFRSSTTSLENQVSNLKRTAASATRRRDSPNRTPRNAERAFSYTSSSDDDGEDSHALSRPKLLKMSDSSRSNSFSSDHKDHHHRISFHAMHFGRSSKEAHHPPAPASLEWKVESPPAILYGDAENSSGALVSGQMFLHVRDGLEVESFSAALSIHVTQKKPFTAHCHDCANQYTELKQWTFLQQPLAMAKGEHAFPFSILLEGHLPASMDGPLVTIAYEFSAEAKVGGQSLKLQRVLDVKRSLPVPETPHHSVRVFPPTNVKASVHYPQVVHPIGSNTLTLRLDGLAKHNPAPNTVEYWKLKKLTWRLEETAKAVAPACEKHAPKAAADDAAARKGVQRSDTHVVGEKTLFSGWKSDYLSLTDSHVDLDLEYSLAKAARYSCDSRSRDGTEVSHQLMVEMVVSQEWAPLNKPNLITQTGLGRILRMHFCTVLTERGGIGISWDNEAPPIYQDVPPSPPSYSEELRGLPEGQIEDQIEPLDGIGGSNRGSMETGGGTSS